MYEAKIIADSIAPGGVRLTTIAVTFPRFVLAEQNTHRVMSRNTASSRAIPIKTRCDAIEANPFIPEAFGKNKRGMQSDELLDPGANEEATTIWKEALADALRHARRMEAIGAHKQYANRLAETFAWVTQIVTATEWDNYMNLRCHKDAQPEIQIAARLMREEMRKSVPRERKVGDWHLPFVDCHGPFPDPLPPLKFSPDGLTWITQADAELSDLDKVKVSVARCAAVSYEKHTVRKTSPEEIARHDNSLSAGHMSPFEHQAKVADDVEVLENAMFKWDKRKKVFAPSMIGNLRNPWFQYRKMIPGEEVFGEEQV